MNRTDKATIPGLIFAVLCLGIALGILIGLTLHGVIDDTDETPTVEGTETPEQTDTETDDVDCTEPDASLEYEECNDEWTTETQSDGA